MGKCFVIQPFDKGTFDKRYVDIFQPAIMIAGYEPYRIDNDLTVSIPINDIEKGISESEICFAEISSNNPNVWYELGFAFACGKEVILVCSDERVGKFPFDIQHRQIITYQTRSSSDYTELGESITKKILALKHKAEKIIKLNSTPVVKTEGLTGHEIAIIILIMENQLTLNNGVAIYNLKDEMGKSGYTNIATAIGMMTLEKNGMIEIFKQADDYNRNEEYDACRVTELGRNWILANQHLLQFRKPAATATVIDDLPF